MDHKWYSGKYDRAFKEVMLKDDNLELLKSIIEHILNIKIEEISILNVEKLRGNVHIKGQRLDLNIKTNNERINVEINSTKKDYLHTRNFSYLADTYSHDVLVGGNYSENIRFIQINLSYELSKDVSPISVYKVVDNEGKEYISNFYIYEVNMEYYLNLWYNNNKKEIEKEYLLIMLGLEKEELAKLAKNNGMVLKYMEDLNKVNEEPEFREYMSYEEDQRKILNTERELAIKETEDKIISRMLDNGMSKVEISKIIGMPEDKLNENPEYREYMSYEEDQKKILNTERELARKEGIEQGIEQGKKEGLINGQSSIINKLLDSGITIEKISEITDLSIDEIKEILNNSN